MTLAHHNHRQVVFTVLALLCKVKVKPVSHHGADHFENHLSKSLSKANSLASTEWKEAHWVPFTAA